MTTNRQIGVAGEIGKVRAGVHLPALPDECGVDTPHAEARLGDNAVVVLARERHQLNQANAKQQRCSAFHNTLVYELGGGG